MTGVPIPHHPLEQLIGALIPASLPRQRPPLLPTIDLPVPSPRPSAVDLVVLSAGQVDRSGRIAATAVVTVLEWRAGMELIVDVAHRRIVLRAAQPGDARAFASTVAAGAKIGLPAAARRMCGIEPGSTVVLAALVTQKVLVIHLAAEIVRMLRRTHSQIIGGRRGR